MPLNQPYTTTRLIEEATSLAYLMLAALGAMALGLGLFGYLWRHPFVLAYLALYAGFDVADRFARPPFDPVANKDQTPACRLNAVLMVALFAAAPFERTYIHGGDPPMLLSAFGVMVQLAGLSLALGARIQLGRFGTPHLEVLDNHDIIRTGLYRRIRHPIYTGGIISRQAWAILWGAPVVFLLGALADVLLMSWRIRTEEAMMAERLGEPYNLYMAETWRLIPGVW